MAATPYWVFHPFGVEQKRADTLLPGRRWPPPALEACADAATLTARLTSIRGIGAWTAAEVVRVVFGDPDAVSVGDYHIPHMVAWALAGEVRAGAREGAPGVLDPADARMLELLEPFRGHRGRVCVLLETGGHVRPAVRPPDAGPLLRRLLSDSTPVARIGDVDLPVMPPVEPMLATSVPEIPTADGMRYEPKWDGFRTIIFRDGDEVELVSRGGKTMTRYFPEVVEQARAQFPPRCVDRRRDRAGAPRPRGRSRSSSSSCCSSASTRPRRG